MSDRNSISDRGRERFLNLIFNGSLTGLLAVVVLWAGPLAAQTPSSLTAASAAMEDGLYRVAERQARAVLATEAPTTDLSAEATLILMRALNGQEKFQEMIDLEGYRRHPGSMEGALLFWHAMGLYGLGRYDGALSALDVFQAKYESTAGYASRARRLRAWCLAKLGRKEEALALFALFARESGDTPEGPANLLDWSRALLEGGDWAGARKPLETLISQAPDSDSGQEARLALAQILIREKKFDKAWNALDTLSADKTVRPDRRAEACFALADLNSAQGHDEAALASADRGLELTQNHNLKQRGQLVRGRILIRMGRIDEGVTLLRKVIAGEIDTPLASRLQLEIARSYAETGLIDRAAAEYQNYLETFTNRAGQAEAAAGKGQVLFKGGRYAESAGAYTRALALLDDPAERAQILCRMGDAWFASGQYIKAAESYLKAPTEYPATELGPQALLQAGESLIRASQFNEGVRWFREVLDQYPASPYAERAALRWAECHEDHNFPAEALEGYTRALQTYTNGQLTARILQRRGILLYRMVWFDAALRDFQDLLARFKTSAFVEQANFMRGWCLYMMGREEEALGVCRTFVEQYPNSEWTPDVLFWLGEYHYNHQFYPEAETQFLELVRKFPQSSIADQALLWAGRAALNRKEYLRAVEHFGRLAKNYPKSQKLADARYYQGDAMTELGDVANAILLFDEILTRHPNHRLIPAAWMRKGDCQFTLGAEDSRRYTEAMTSYRNVLGGTGVPADLRFQAEYKIGRCLEKMARTDEALEHYYTRVVVRFLEDPAGRLSPDSPAAVWFTRAAFAVADILEAQDNRRRAVRVLQRVVDAGVPAAADAQARIDKIRAEFWGLF